MVTELSEQKTISLFGLETVLAGARPGRGPVTCNGLAKSVKGVLAASLSGRLGKPLVVVCDKAARAEEFYATLGFFMPPEDRGGSTLLYFPPWEILPYEELSPHPEISGQRLATLYSLAQGGGGFTLVTTVEAVTRKVPPPAVMRGAAMHIMKGGTLDLDGFADRLVSWGYRRAKLAEERGEFSIRGGIVDVFTASDSGAVRVELFGDKVDSIRRYNPETQRSTGHLEEFLVTPHREVFYGADDDDGALSGRMAEALDAAGAGGSEKERLASLFRGRSFFNGMENYTPVFFPEACSLFDYLPGDASLIVDEPHDVEHHLASFRELIETRFDAAMDGGQAPPEPEALFVDGEELSSAFRERAILNLGELAVGAGEDEDTLVISTRAARRYRGDLDEFSRDVSGMVSQGYMVTLAAHTPGGADRLANVLKEADLGAERLEDEKWASVVASLCDPQPRLFEGGLYITTGKIAEGFVIPADKWAVITEDEIFGKIHKVKRRPARGRKVFGTNLAKLAAGDLVVHGVHGVGRYLGSREMMIDDSRDEYLEVEYAENQRLYVPMRNVDQLTRYTGGGGHRPALDRMGGATWGKTRAKVKKNLLKMAGKLLKIFAARELGEGCAFSPDTSFHREFADTFEYEETEDQLAAIMDVAADMERKKPMDRLVCGDVGYGKTEVAMRAAFKTVFDGKQVALLVPTTLLAQQHYQTFMERFKSFPVEVGALSRFRSAREQKEIIKKAASGGIDILIGTHRLLQKDISFKELGLVIIDEEQRFGVAHKEKLRSVRASVDVLTLTATPIPRTLHTSLLGIRDLSVIETPPPDRQSVRTFIAKFSGKVVREAALRELDRGGQIFFVHNKVKSIHSMKRYLGKVTPEARVGVAHGQMPEKELENVMADFMEKRIDILLCTTIIESGLDIPSANTIMINRADHFGLAQLYQLRGRVGRDRHRAYSYLFIPGLAALSETARKRIRAIEELSELGSGFQLAAKDMEIRGVGNLLGAEQSGQIDSVGFETYCEMLEETIRELRGQPPREKTDVSMNLGFQGRISPEYVPDLDQRIDLYNRLNSAETLAVAGDMAGEIRDRFGPPPEETEKLLAAARLRILAMELRMEKVDIARGRVYLVFSPSTGVSPERLVEAASGKGRKFRFVSESAVEFNLEGDTWHERFESLFGFLRFVSERTG